MAFKLWMIYIHSKIANFNLVLNFFKSDLAIFGGVNHQRQFEGKSYRRFEGKSDLAILGGVNRQTIWG